MATPMLNIARVHKMLHHKCPHLVPLLDSRTIIPIGRAAKAARCTGWQLIWDEIRDHDACFKQGSQSNSMSMHGTAAASPCRG